MKLTSIITTLAALTGLTLAATAMPASAYTFGNVTGGDTVGDAFNGQFSFDVVDKGNNTVLFNISKANTNDAMFIGGVFFDVSTNLLTSVNTINFNNVINPNSTGGGGVKFSAGANNAQLPQGGQNFTTDYSFLSDNGSGNKWGVQSNETLEILFNGNYTDVISAINAGTLKLGLHVQNIGANGDSDTYISEVPTVNPTPKPVPEPATILGLGMVAAGMTIARRRKVVS